MRFLVTILMFCAAQSHAQVVGWADCKHTQTYERLTWVKVALMEGNTERRSAIRAFEKLKPGTNTVMFNELTGPVTITGMRLHCTFSFDSGHGVSGTKTEFTVEWEKPQTLSAGVKAKTGLNLMLVETSAGLWRAYIGKAP